MPQSLLENLSIDQYPVHSERSKHLVCPHCKCLVTVHDFMVDGSHLVRTEHCEEHGDVVAMLSAVVNPQALAGRGA